jgi:mono/diheme cytochrome c family protein
MRMTKLATGLVLAAAAWAPQAIAQSLPPNNFGPWKNLGTLGNGRRAFLEFGCAQCHGNTGTGGGRAPDITPANTGGITYDQVYNVVMRGEPYGGMPAFGKYATVNDINNLYAYINNFGQPNQPSFIAWWQQQPQY